jgi:hypothetical protein
MLFITVLVRGGPRFRLEMCLELPEDSVSKEQGVYTHPQPPPSPTPCFCSFSSITNHGLDRTWLEIPLLPPPPDSIHHHLECDAETKAPGLSIQIMNRRVTARLRCSTRCLPASGNTSFSRKAFICQQRDNVKTLKTNQTEGRGRRGRQGTVWERQLLSLGGISLIC